MLNYDVIQIVDVYGHYYDRQKQTMKIDIVDEAKTLGMLIKPLGRNDYKTAIVAQDDERRQGAYSLAGFSVFRMKSNRNTELRQFIRTMRAQIEQSPPKYLVLVSDDPEFAFLCDAVEPITNLAVWANSSTCPSDLKDPRYGWRPLEDLLPDLKIARIDVRVDMENLFLGLVRRGWQPNAHELMKTIRLALKDIGEVANITAYADFDEINRCFGGPNVNWQRELTLAGCESRYVINQHGKNTADMKIAEDIRTLIEYGAHTYNPIDIICLVTMDRDFRHIVDTARMRGKRIVVLGLEGMMSRELESAAREVRFLDVFLELAKLDKRQASLDQPLRVFLCYSSSDKPAVRALYRRLCNEGITPWIDQENILPGKDWDREITKSVRNSDVIIVCLSKGSITKSGYVQKEIKLALDVADEKPEDDIFLIPVKLEECTVPDKLSKRQWVNLFEQDGYERLLLALNERISKA